jgi:hypothetical protein
MWVTPAVHLKGKVLAGEVYQEQRNAAYNCKYHHHPLFYLEESVTKQAYHQETW